MTSEQTPDPRIEAAALAWRNWDDGGEYPQENIDAERIWAARALAAADRAAPPAPPQTTEEIAERQAEDARAYLAGELTPAPPAPPDALAIEDKMQETLAMALTSWFRDEQGSVPLGVDLMCEALDVTGLRLVRVAAAAPPAPPDAPEDFEKGTRTIRKWLAHQTVATNALAAELRTWADYWSGTAAPPAIPPREAYLDATEEWGMYRERYENATATAARLAEALRALLPVALVWDDNAGEAVPVHIEHEPEVTKRAREALGDYDARTEGER